MIRGLYKTDVVTIAADRSIADAAKLMAENNVGDVVVVEDSSQSQSTSANTSSPETSSGKLGHEPAGRLLPIGILTDRDIVISCLAQGRDAEETKIADVMSKNLSFVQADMGLFETIRRMREAGVGRILVVDENKYLMGILSAQRIFELLNEELHELGQIARTKKSSTVGGTNRLEDRTLNQGPRSPGSSQGFHH